MEIGFAFSNWVKPKMKKVTLSNLVRAQPSTLFFAAYGGDGACKKTQPRGDPIVAMNLFSIN